MVTTQVTTHPNSDHTRSARAGDDRGQVAMEYLGFLPLLLLVAMAAIQLGLAAYAANQAGTAARAGARTEASVDARGSGESNARDAVSDWVEDGGFRYRKSGGQDVTVTVRVKVPSVVPGLKGWWAERSTTMPNENSRFGF
ncbi:MULTISPECIES: TadE/TadG family type IV pilus assembly protein [Streptomyces]|uniref:TadE/TadG family type IV pilus assembly protein n=1 Tax=Streptomyces TaxID=1883 RepID=UPI00211D8FD6|nr:TadE/TadG family type IV pilus assembly protein [Streptomyces sp. st115]WSV23652.1 pilus assembly protein [Streptomyces fimicarius]WTC87439.1 pilus assembly protein [Streptomyces griseus]WTD69938.1 pilus assembly protein [Streptomyces griseus]